MISVAVNLSFAQAPKKMTSAEIYHALEKLQFLGSALYVAAHPDDENTRLIAYLANDVKANTAYLSLTRGDGGQNLIGTELAEQLGVLRTQELLAARRTDGGKQMFSRAIDFGYSKHPDETLSIWNEEEVLADVVWAIRKHKPDIIVNRFDHRTPGRTHGHHTSSAMLSVKAFQMTNDKSVYSEQLEHVDPWQVSRQFFNTSWWFYGSREKFAEADKSNLMGVDVGTYYPTLGKSNTEIAAESRSMHKCQGFGSTGTRGSETEFLEIINGEMPTDKKSLFEGINTTWTRVAGGKIIGEKLATIQREFNLSDPSSSISALMDVRELILKISDEYWKDIKLTEIDKIIQASLGLFLETKADDFSAVPGQSIDIEIEAINRSSADVTLKKVIFHGVDSDTTTNLALLQNENQKLFANLTLSKDASYTSPYWLTIKGSLGMYHVDNRLDIGKPESPGALQVEYQLSIDNRPISFIKDLVYKKNDPVDGEVYQPFTILPEATVSLADKVYIFNSTESKTIHVKVRAHTDDLKGTIELCHPNDWSVSPKSYEVDLASKGMDKQYSFILTPPDTQSVNYIVPLMKVGDKSYSDNLIEVDYNHVPKQTTIQDASSKVVKLAIEKAGNKIGYIMGAGDQLPTGLRQIGYEVELITPEEITENSLDKYDAIMTGIRAYNTLDNIKFKQDILLDYVQNGGNLIIQYNTSRRFSLDNIGPYPLKLSRDRVTDEFAEVRFKDPNHQILNFPNKITSDDFEEWVQERGLYFPGEWDEHYEAIFSMNDKGEDPKDGSLLVTKYGKGYYMYTGISFFREIPAGVPGAYRLLANMISIGKNNRQ